MSEATTPSTPGTARPSSGHRNPLAAGANEALKKAGWGCAPVVIFVAVVLVVVSALRSCSSDDVSNRLSSVVSPSSTAITLGGTTTVLAADGKATELVVTTQDSEDGETVRRLTRLRVDGSGITQLWQSEPLDSGASRAEIAVVGDTLFAGIDDTLLALDSASGTTSWTTTLRDKVTTDCESCFAAVGDVLIVHTADAYVGAYGTRSAEQLWSKRLNSPAGSISIHGDQVLVVDDPEDPQQLTPSSSLDPRTGKVLRTATPSCSGGEDTPWDLELSPQDRIHSVSGSTDVVAAFGFGDVCVARWSPLTGETRWTTRLIGASSTDRAHEVIGTKDLVLPVSSSALVTVDLATGTPRELSIPLDTSAVPNLIAGRTLVADSATTRGTVRAGLVAWDLSSGERLWATRADDGAAPASNRGGFSSDALFEGSPRSVLVPTADGVNRFSFEGTDHTFTVRPVDVRTGDLGAPVQRSFLQRYESGTPSLTVEAVDRGRLVVSIDSLLQAIPISGIGDLVSYPELR